MKEYSKEYLDTLALLQEDAILELVSLGAAPDHIHKILRPKKYPQILDIITGRGYQIALNCSSESIEYIAIPFKTAPLTNWKM